MNQIEEKIKSLLAERETIITEMEEIQKAFNFRQQRIIEIAGSIKTLQELLPETNENSKNDKKD